jgi:hypothetical protein
VKLTESSTLSTVALAVGSALRRNGVRAVSLRSDSPCLAENNPCGRTMGAVSGVGCTP